MKRKIVLSVAFLLALMLTLSAMPFASAATKAVSGVQFELSSDKESYVTGDTIQLALNVTNTNDQEMNLTYDVQLPEGLIAATERGVLAVAAGGKANASIAVTIAKGADGVPSTGDSFPLEAAIVLLVVSAMAAAILLKKTRFVAMLLLCVMLAGVALPANVASAETAGKEIIEIESNDELLTFSEEEQVEILDGVTLEEHEEQLAEQEMELLEDLPEEAFDSTDVIGEFEVTKDVLVDNQLKTITVIGTITGGEVLEHAEAARSLGSVRLKSVTILGVTKFKLTWNRVPGATHYEVWHSDGGAYKKRATCVSTTWTTNYGTFGKINTYKVRAITKYGNYIYDYGPYSTRTCYGMSQPGTVGVSHRSSSSEAVTVKWRNTSFCSGYYVYRSLTGATGSYKLIGRTYSRNTTSFVDQYYNGYYKIRPYYTSGQTGITYSGPATGLMSMPTQYRALIICQDWYYSVDSTQETAALNGRAGMLQMLKFTGGSIGAYRPKDTWSTRNPTAAGIKSAMKTAFQRAKAGDVSLIYYIGCAYNGSNYDDWGAWEGRDDYYIGFDTLRDWMDEIPGKKIVISDTAYSGALIGKGGNAFEVDKNGTFEVTQEMCDEATNNFIKAFEEPEARYNLAARNYYVLTATSGYQTGYLNTDTNSNIPHFRFTAYLLYGGGIYPFEDNRKLSVLPSDTNRDGDASLHEMYTYVRNSLNSSAAATGMYQSAQVYPTNSSQIILGR